MHNRFAIAPYLTKKGSFASLFKKTGAGKETFTRRVSRCFPNTFFAEVASEDLNCSLVFRPRQQVRPKKSIDVQRRTLHAPDPHPAHRHPRGLELAPHIPFSASASLPRCRLGSRLPMSGQFGCQRGKARTAHRGAICASHAGRTHTLAMVRRRAILYGYIRMPG